MKPALLPQVTRYVLGGITTTALTWTSIWLFVEYFSIHYMVAINLGAGVAYSYSYFINKTFVFSDSNGGHLIKGSKFLLLQFFLVLTTNIIVYIFVSRLNAHYMIVMVSLSVVNAAFSFFIMRTSIFLASQDTKSLSTVQRELK